MSAFPFFPNASHSASLSELSSPSHRYILEEARSLGLIGAGYIWIVSSLTTGNPDFTPEVPRPRVSSQVATSEWFDEAAGVFNSRLVDGHLFPLYT